MDAMDSAHDARRPVGPRLRARPPPGRPVEDPRHAPRQRDLSPDRGDPLPVRQPRETPDAPEPSLDPRHRADHPRVERPRPRGGHAGPCPRRRPRPHDPALGPHLRDRRRPGRRRRGARPTRRSIRRSSRSSRASVTSARSPRRATATSPPSRSRPAASRRLPGSTRSSSRRSPTTARCARATRARSGRSATTTRRSCSSTRAIELEPLNVEAYHNRAVVHERRGEKAAAIRDYQTAVKYNPQYEPSRRALARLGGALAPGAPVRRGEARGRSRRRSGRGGPPRRLRRGRAQARRGRADRAAARPPLPVPGQRRVPPGRHAPARSRRSSRGSRSIPTTPSSLRT